MIDQLNISRSLVRMMSGRGALRSASLALFTTCAVFTVGSQIGSPAAAAGIKVTTTDARDQLKLGLDKSVIITLPGDAYDILVANPAVADAVTRTSRRIYLFGKRVGQTNIFVFGANGEQIASFDLSVERDVAGLEANIKRFIPNSDIKVELISDNVVLTGTAETPLDAKRAADLAQIFIKGGEATTGQFSGGESTRTSGGGVSIVNYDGAEGRQDSSIVNLIQIIGEDQVTLKVTVAEVSRNVMKQLGVRSVGTGSSNGISWGSGITAPTYGAALAGAANFGIGKGPLSAYFLAMEQQGVMKTLAEPTLTAVSGEQASFKVGGEFQKLTQSSAGSRNFLGFPTGGGSASYSTQEWGISLNFKPVVLSAGRISLKVRTEVSEPTNESSGTLDSTTTLPSLRKRLADTTVELPSGGSMMIAGLVRDDVRQVLQGVPGASKVPILGALARSRDFVRNETELVVIVTPYLVRPTARNELARPDDNFNASSDGAGMFLGRVNRVYGTMKTNKPNGRYHGAVGFIYK